MDSLQGRTLDARYEITALIGSGSTADTYRAHDARLGRDVAVKVLLDTSKDVTARLLLEARAMAALNHPRIVSVYDVGRDGDVPYIAMELLPGRTLRDLESGSLTYGQALGYLTDMLDALAYAHERGVIHRDVKPSNVITVDDGRHVKLADFGLAQRISDVTQTTRTGQMIGTIAYLAPERFLSKPPDVRGDLYSVGIVMYEIFTGTMPFRNEGDDLVATMFSHVHDLPAPARAVNRNIPEPLERIIMRAIERDPQRRYQSAHAFGEDVRALSRPLLPTTGGMRTPRSTNARERPEVDASLRRALDRALAPARNRSDALEAVLRGMMATRRRRYDEAREAYLAALSELHTAGDDVEYAKTALKYGSMLLQKASDGLRERSELREGVSRLNDALRIFQDLGLHDRYGETEHLVNALERTAIGLY